MIHPSPTALEEIRKRHDRDDVNEFTRRFFGPFHEDRAALLTHIAALEAEMAADKKIKEAVCSQLEIADFANASLALACVQDELKRLQAEAQLATRLPTRAEIEAKFGEWAMTGESTVMKARWMHEWLLSGAATPAPTAAVTEERRVAERRGETPREYWLLSDKPLRRRGDRRQRAKSPPQGAEE